jgi:RNA polymerase sigma factor (sigma-70 family)
MASGQMSEVIQHLRRTMFLRDGTGLTDGQLLTDYISRRDEAALAALVRRHGPMVWGVCRRILRNYHDAEDAFQATFLVLVRKAASIASRELVANWLYGVAHQTALKARATAARRKERERQVTEMPEPAVMEQDLWSDLQPLLDEELAQLPDKYRSVIVLCCLEGKTRKEAARQLSLPEGTVGGWLARARAMLAKRLAQRGVTLSGGVILARNVASAGVPMFVMANTIKAASAFAAGQAAASGLISARAIALTEGVLKTMFFTRLKISTAVLATMLIVTLSLGAIGTGVGLSTHAVAAGPQPRAASNAAARQEAAEAALVEAERDFDVAAAQLELAKARLEQAKRQVQLAKLRLIHARGPKEAKAQLEGGWKLIAEESEGRFQSYPQGVGVTLGLNAGEYTLTMGPRIGGQGNVGLFHSLHAFYEHDPKKGTLDLMYPALPKGKPNQLGIYKVEGDRLTICWGKRPEGDEAPSDRPTEFSTKPGSGRNLEVFERIKE